jgi:hypothetical protein
MVPDGADRKFETLVRAIQQVRREHEREKFLIFTQYRETLEYLRTELGKLYTSEKIATIRGGPLEDKIAAIESFWDENGAQFLVSTSAGGEGINLQVCHIVFNYDLPWNPMAVEQRIGRIHRYGQRDTAQVYTLVAEDTVEERIYGLLDQKLLEIAQTIGRVDEVTGQVTEDFRLEILGFLGSSPSYQDLYKKALVDKDYLRTEREIAEAVDRARQASEALRALTQGLDAFNLQDYLRLRGQYTLADLKDVITTAILRLGGAVLPDGQFLRIEVPASLRATPGVASRYEHVTFHRDLAMRVRKAQLFGVGHPFVDALLDYLRSARFPGEASILSTEEEANWSVRFLADAELEAGRHHTAYEHFLIGDNGSWETAPDRMDIENLGAVSNRSDTTNGTQDWSAALSQIRPQVARGEADLQARLRSQFDGVLAIRTRLVGITRVHTFGSEQSV